MNLSKRSFAILLALTPDIGGRRLTSIQARCSLLDCSPEDFLALSAEAMAEEFKLTPKSIHALKTNQKEHLKWFLAEEKKLTGLGIRLITTMDGDYPARIEQFDLMPPGVLFTYGSHKLFDRETFTVLASRNAPKGALDRIESDTEESVLQGKVLVGGVDRVEYQRASVVPLRWGAPRILCLDRGLIETFGKDLKSEAFAAARLWRHEFDPKTDLAVTPFRPEAHCKGVNNRVRDRLAASLSDRLDFVHIAEGGNMEKLLLKALEAGRHVRVWEGMPGFEKYVPLGAATFS